MEFFYSCFYISLEWIDITKVNKSSKNILQGSIRDEYLNQAPPLLALYALFTKEVSKSQKYLLHTDNIYIRSWNNTQQKITSTFSIFDQFILDINWMMKKLNKWGSNGRKSRITHFYNKVTDPRSLLKLMWLILSSITVFV